jgi:hypothetical protein
VSHGLVALSFREGHSSRKLVSKPLRYPTLLLEVFFTLHSFVAAL